MLNRTQPLIDVPFRPLASFSRSMFFHAFVCGFPNEPGESSFLTPFRRRPLAVNLRGLQTHRQLHPARPGRPAGHCLADLSRCRAQADVGSRMPGSWICFGGSHEGKPKGEAGKDRPVGWFLLDGTLLVGHVVS